jgi:hypothetical protein
MEYRAAGTADTALPVIAGLADTLLYRIAAGQGHNHYGAHGGACRRCGQAAPCPTQQHARAVCVAAGPPADVAVGFVTAPLTAPAVPARTTGGEHWLALATPGGRRP